MPPFLRLLPAERRVVAWGDAEDKLKGCRRVFDAVGLGFC